MKNIVSEWNQFDTLLFKMDTAISRVKERIGDDKKDYESL